MTVLIDARNFEIKLSNSLFNNPRPVNNRVAFAEREEPATLPVDTMSLQVCHPPATPYASLMFTLEELNTFRQSIERAVSILDRTQATSTAINSLDSRIGTLPSVIPYEDGMPTAEYQESALKRLAAYHAERTRLVREIDQGRKEFDETIAPLLIASDLLGLPPDAVFGLEVVWGRLRQGMLLAGWGFDGVRKWFSNLQNKVEAQIFRVSRKESFAKDAGDSLPAHGLDSASESSLKPVQYVFAKQADGFFYVSAFGKSALFSPMDGFDYLYALLRRPGEFLALSEFAGMTNTPATKATFQEFADPQARAEYRAKHQELRHEIEEAREAGHFSLQEEKQCELEALQAYMSKLAGRGGKPRNLNDHENRRANAIYKAIRRACEKMAERELEELVAHIKSCISRDRGFIYRPKDAIEWSFDSVF